MGKLFGTDGARGIAITELTCELAMDIGKAAAMALAKSRAGNRPQIVVGMDTRASSEVLAAALAAGICSVGADAVLCGVIPTPACAFLVKRLGADAGVMISASHNPAQYNGIKLFSESGMKLPDSAESEIERIVISREFALRGGAETGRIIRRETAAEEYAGYIKECAGGSLSGMRVALDCANGSACATAERIFRSLGAEVTMLSDKPDGMNINENCGSTKAQRLCAAVKEQRLDAGFAFDGDADRCIAADENGALVDGDSIIAVLARQMKAEGRLKSDTAVVTVMSNLGLRQALLREGIATVTTKVGDRYVLEEMLRGGYNIGGEQSGHVILSDYAPTGDGELTAVMLARAMKQTGKPMSALCAGLTRYPQAQRNVLIPADLRGKWQNSAPIAAAIAKAEEALGGSGRVLVRESGTEPLIRILTEGKDAAQINALADNIAKIITNIDAPIRRVKT